MKAISLWQPWATLIAWNSKQYETRSWATPYRGLLAIHAANRKPESVDVMHMKDTFYAACRVNQHPEQYGLHSLPLGAMLCICELEAIYHTEAVRSHLSDSELSFGDYSPGRYAWKLKIIEVFDKPIPIRGMQGLWEWTRP